MDVHMGSCYYLGIALGKVSFCIDSMARRRSEGVCIFHGMVETANCMVEISCKITGHY